jgi:hypothetical protein
MFVVKPGTALHSEVIAWYCWQSFAHPVQHTMACVGFTTCMHDFWCGFME